ncbi:uncharacterized protein [Aegilops tauschii subsp. strangulata]|uniref:uncharacterized protein n=1 Tax=Aegilops tauschii subsp. strangulata TaxID=200361 RepID=UPI000989C173|nr:uncharacterized protein LOC109743234 [Aegilops tauschii subsp. strangulata]
MQFWSLEGAEGAFGDFGRIDRLDSRTLERGHTRTFTFWLWAWDVAHIPTKRALWVLKRGAGRVDEILGYSPPDRRVPSPPGVRRYDLLLHVDRVEDWSPLSPRSSHSGQSGLPSSSSDDRPFPRVEPGSWTGGIEDGQEHGRHLAAWVATATCRAAPRVERRDHDEDGAGGQRHSWRDAFLGNSCHAKGKSTDVLEATPRHRNRTPVGSRHGNQGRGRASSKAAAEVPPLRATPPLPLRPVATVPRLDAQEPGPVAAFFSFPGGRALSPPPRTDVMQLEIENAMLDALNSRLAFEDGERSPPHARTRSGAIEDFHEDDDILPCIADLSAPLSSPRISSPAPAAVGFLVEAITQKVDCLQLGGGQGPCIQEVGDGSCRVGLPQLFAPVPQAVLPALRCDRAPLLLPRCGPPPPPLAAVPGRRRRAVRC